MDMVFTIESLALGFAHAVYRNTSVEDFHSLSRTMDEGLYKDVYRITDRQIKKAVINKDKIKYLHNKNISVFTDQNELKMIYAPIVGDILFGIQCSAGWDKPQEIEELPKRNLAKYLLGGEFISHCNGKNIFDDSVMKTINKDIANRSLMILKHVILV